MALAVLCGVVLTPVLFWAAFLFLVSQEDYTPVPGTLTYYLGISSLVRGVTVTGAAGSPQYYGTTGDGNKQARSEVAYELPPEHLNQAVAAINTYLQHNGWRERSVEDGHRAVLRYAEYTSQQGGLVVLEVQPLQESQTHRLSVSEYE